MAYTVYNYKSKKALVEDVKSGKSVSVYQPGPFGPDVKDGTVCIEGPHYPEAHRWYASGTVKDGILIKVK
jgi:hypothetical protein